MRRSFSSVRGIDADGWKQRFADFVRFSLDLSQISGRRFLAETDMRSRTAPDMQQFLRPDEEIAAVEGENVLGEVRYNADGTLDFLRWNRPQYDGPAFRALACLRYLDAGAVADDTQGIVAELIRLDLHYTAEHAGEPCYDLWEEEIARHYYTCLVQFAALQKGAHWAKANGHGDYAARLDAAAQRLREMLDGFWSPGKGFYLEPRHAGGRDDSERARFRRHSRRAPRWLGRGGGTAPGMIASL